VRTIKRSELDEILKKHRAWVKSDGKKGERADFSRAELSGADLSGAYLSGAYLSGAYLENADLRNADLSRANLSYAGLKDADLSLANLKDADLSLANLSRANLNLADLTNADLSDANLSDANLKDADLSLANLSRANLNLADLTNADLSDANLSHAELRSADLIGANLRDADFSLAILSDGILSGAKLSYTKLFFTNLQKVIFRGATLSKVSLQGADLTEADLTAIHIDRETAAQIPDVLREKYEGSWVFLKDESVIKRSIEFPPEYHQAGISILNEFGSVLRTKYPDTKAKIRIEQDGLKVTMIIDPVGGSREVIEKELDKYGLVIKGQMTPEEYAPNNPLLVIELKSELRNAHYRIETQRDMLQLKEKEHDGRIQTLEQSNQSLKEEVQWLRHIVGTAIQTPHNINIKALGGNVGNDKITINNTKGDVAFAKDKGFVTANKTTIQKSGSSKDVDFQSIPDDIRAEFEALHERLTGIANLSEADVQEIKSLLASIEKKKPVMRHKIVEISRKVVVGAAGSGLWTGIFEFARLLLP